MQAQLRQRRTRREVKIARDVVALLSDERGRVGRPRVGAANNSVINAAMLRSSEGARGV